MSSIRPVEESLLQGIQQANIAGSVKGTDRQEKLSAAKRLFQQALKGPLSNEHDVLLASKLQYKIEVLDRGGVESGRPSRLNKLKARLEKIQMNFYRRFFKEGAGAISDALRVIDNVDQFPEEAEGHLHGAFQQVIFAKESVYLDSFKSSLAQMAAWKELSQNKKLPKVIQKALIPQLNRYATLQKTLDNLESLKKAGEKYSLESFGIDDLVNFFGVIHADKATDPFMKARINNATTRFEAVCKEQAIPLEAIKILAEGTWKENESIIRDFVQITRHHPLLKEKIKTLLSSPTKDRLMREVTKLDYDKDYLKDNPLPLLKSIVKDPALVELLKDKEWEVVKLSPLLQSRLKAYIDDEGDLKAIESLFTQLTERGLGDIFVKRIRKPFDEAKVSQEGQIKRLAEGITALAQENREVSIQKRYELLDALPAVEKSLDHFSTIHGKLLGNVRGQIGDLKESIHNELLLLNGPPALSNLYALATRSNQAIKLLNSEEAAIYLKWADQQADVLSHTSVSEEVRNEILEQLKKAVSLLGSRAKEILAETSTVKKHLQVEEAPQKAPSAASKILAKTGIHKPAANPLSKPPTEGQAITTLQQLNRFEAELLDERNPEKREMAVKSDTFIELVRLRRGQLVQDGSREMAEATLHLKQLEALAEQYNRPLPGQRKRGMDFEKRV